MRYVATLFWGAILGQVIGFLVGALANAPYNPVQTLIMSVVFVILLFALPPVMKRATPNSKED